MTHCTISGKLQLAGCDMASGDGLRVQCTAETRSHALRQPASFRRAAARILQKQVELATIDMWNSSESLAKPHPGREGE
jgi:hypothetical protein